VKINSQDLDDKDFVNKTIKDAEDILKDTENREQEILKIVESKM
jgi:formiminotetrahydrofolate cyclodeaminase